MKKHLHNSLRALFLSLAVLMSLPMLAEEINGINYDLNADATQATVIKKSSGGYYGDVVIPESVEFGSTAYSVTSIGGYAFMGCSGLTSVTIPNSVTSIGNDAFYRCSDLTSVHIYDIAAWCNIDFADYDSNPLDYAHHLYLNGEEVKDLVIPNSVTSIKNYVFYDCSGLTSVTIPNSVTSIGNDAFYGCSGLTSVTIPNSVESIGEYAFAYCSGLTSVTIGNGVESIGRLAFRECSKLSDVYCYAEIVPSTESNAFGDSPIGTATLYVPAGSVDSYKNAEPWSVFGTIDAIPPFSGELEIDGINYEFDADTERAAVIKKSSGEYSGVVIIPESVEHGGTAYSVTRIGPEAFFICPDLTSVTIPNSVEYIGSRAFAGCTGLTSVTIGNSVTSIGDGAFGGCSGLTSVTIPNSVTSIGYQAFAICPKLLNVYCYAVEVPSTKSDAFDDSYTENPTLHVPAGSVENYKETAPWSGFENIVAISTEINGIRYVLNAETTQATVIAKSSGKYSGEVIIPESVTHENTTYSVTSIGEEAFRGCSDLTSVTIGNSVASIGNYAFYECSGLTSVHISDIIAWCNIDFGGEYSNPLSYANLLYLNGEEVQDLEIPNSVTSIEGGAFSNCSALTSVTIPNSVTSIGEGAFLGCSGLTSVTIPNSVTSIGSSAFLGCSALTSVTIPNSVESIGNAAFSGCSGLTSVTIPNSVTSIGHTAFSDCSRLTSVTIGNGVESIEWGAFLGCSGLTSVTIPSSVESIGISAFNGCSALTSVSIPNSVTSIGSSAFEGCSGLTSVHISDIIAWCNIEFGDSYSNPLYKAHNLYLNEEEVKDLVIPNSVTSIGDYAFNGCSGLTSVTIPNSVESIGISAFKDCYRLTSVTIPNSVTSIGDGAFSGCSGLTSVTIGNSVTSIGNGAFSDCSDLTSVTIPNSVTSIGDLAFYSCTGLTSVTIGNGVESIGVLAFANWENLTDVYCYAKNVPSTESNAFEGLDQENATLHVPAASIERYNATAPWSGFANIVAIPNQYELSVSSAGYATLCLAYNAEIPQDVEVYVAEKVDGDCLKMKKVEGVLPAMTGVIVKANKGTYAFVQSEDTPAEIGENLLVGSVVNTMVRADENTSYYILATPDDNNNEVGMYRVELIDDMFECKANKAYLPIPSAVASSARIYFDFGTETGILETENGNVKTENCYDLSGRRVQNAKKGIFIVNGKKVVK